MTVLLLTSWLLQHCCGLYNVGVFALVLQITDVFQVKLGVFAPRDIAESLTLPALQSAAYFSVSVAFCDKIFCRYAI